MKEIILTDGQKAQVDDEDFEWLNQYTWRAEKHGKMTYAVTDWMVNGERKTITMHELIMGFMHKHN